MGNRGLTEQGGPARPQFPICEMSVGLNGALPEGQVSDTYLEGFGLLHQILDRDLVSFLDMHSCIPQTFSEHFLCSRPCG